jgi:flagellar basal-body rod protein FlgC
MDYSQIFAISAAALAAEHKRVEVAAMNLANANTLAGPDGAGYQPLRVVMRPMPPSPTSPDFAARMAAEVDEPGLAQLTGPAASVEPALTTTRQVYDPGNPYADTKGFVHYPGVDTATEMVNMMSALRAYEANVAAINMAKTMAGRALEIGAGNSSS